MKYQLTVQVHFDAAHRIPDYNGPCSRLHGHRWLVRAMWEFSKSDTLGMACDLVALRKQLGVCTVDFDHINLCQILKRPSAELIAELIYTRLTEHAEASPLPKPAWVEVEESPGQVVRYTP